MEQPELLTSPTLNSRVSLTCGAVGVPDPQITWFKDGFLLPGERSRNLVIQEMQLSDRGTYNCRASNFDKENLNQVEAVSLDVLMNIAGKGLHLNLKREREGGGGV